MADDSIATVPLDSINWKTPASALDASVVQKNSVFLTMAAELRQRIYKHVFANQHVQFYPTDAVEYAAYPDEFADNTYPECANLLLVNRQICAEACPIFYNTVSLRLDYVQSHLMNEDLADSCCGRFRNVTVFDGIKRFAKNQIEMENLTEVQHLSFHDDRAWKCAINFDHIIKSEDTLFHEGADKIIFRREGQGYKDSVESLADQMRTVLSKIQQQHKPAPSKAESISVTVNWGRTRVAGTKEQCPVFWRVDYALTVWDDGSFTLEYSTSGDKSYLVKQKTFGESKGTLHQVQDWMEFPSDYVESWTRPHDRDPDNEITKLVQAKIMLDCLK